MFCYGEEREAAEVVGDFQEMEERVVAGGLQEMEERAAAEVAEQAKAKEDDSSNSSSSSSEDEEDKEEDKAEDKAEDKGEDKEEAEPPEVTCTSPKAATRLLELTKFTHLFKGKEDGEFHLDWQPSSSTWDDREIRDLMDLDITDHADIVSKRKIALELERKAKRRSGQPSKGTLRLLSGRSVKAYSVEFPSKAGEDHQGATLFLSRDARIPSPGAGYNWARVKETEDRKIVEFAGGRTVSLAPKLDLSGKFSSPWLMLNKVQPEISFNAKVHLFDKVRATGACHKFQNLLLRNLGLLASRKALGDMKPWCDVKTDVAELLLFAALMLLDPYMRFRLRADARKFLSNLKVEGLQVSSDSKSIKFVGSHVWQCPPAVGVVTESIRKARGTGRLFMSKALNSYWTRPFSSVETLQAVCNDEYVCSQLFASALELRASSDASDASSSESLGSSGNLDAVLNRALQVTALMTTTILTDFDFEGATDFSTWYRDLAEDAAKHMIDRLVQKPTKADLDTCRGLIDPRIAIEAVRKHTGYNHSELVEKCSTMAFFQSREYFYLDELAKSHEPRREPATSPGETNYYKILVSFCRVSAACRHE